MSSNVEHVIPFRLVDITTEEFATFRNNHRQADQNFDIDLGIETRINAETMLVGMYTRFSFNQVNQPVCVLKCGCHFQIEPDYWNKQITNDSIQLPASFLTHLLVLTVGTSRGVFHAKKPNWLGGVFLSTINVLNLITEDQQFSLIEEGNER